MNLDKIIEACEWVIAKKMTYNDRYRGHCKGGVTIEVTWADWEHKLFNPVFACVWKHYADTRNSMNLKFNDLRDWYVEAGEYLAVPPGMVENFHIHHLQPSKAIAETTRSETARALREKYPRVNPIIPDHCLGNGLMLRFFSSDAREQEREYAEDWLSSNLDKARACPTLKHLVAYRENPNWKNDPWNKDKLLTLRLAKVI